MTHSHNRTVVLILLVLLVVNVLGWAWTASSLGNLESDRASSEPLESLSSKGAEYRSSETDFEPNLPELSPFRDTDFGIEADVAGISRPRLRRADEVGLESDTLVVGIELDGHFRAYALEAFEIGQLTNPRQLAKLIVHDVIDGRSICVVHCNLTHSTRVLTNPNQTTESAPKPSKVRVGGWANGMLLLVGGTRYPQHSHSIPLEDVPYLTTTWKDWADRHPETLVYTGGVDSQ